MHVLREVNTFLFLRLLHSSSGNIYSVLLRSRIAPGCPAATRTRTVREVLYAASDVFVVAVVVSLLVAIDGIHHRSGDPRDQFHWHPDDPRKLPEPQVSSTACLATLIFRIPVRAIPTTCVRGAASDQAFGATCCSTTSVLCGMLEVLCFVVCSLLLVVLYAVHCECPLNKAIPVVACRARCAATKPSPA